MPWPEYICSEELCVCVWLVGWVGGCERAADLCEMAHAYLVAVAKTLRCVLVSPQRIVFPSLKMT